MKFCVKCGNQLNDTDCFCSKCGTPCGTAAGNSVNGMPPVPPIPPASEVNKTDSSKSENTTKYGALRKCPNCGKPVESFLCKCECGYEFTDVKLSKRLSDFQDGLIKYEGEAERKFIETFEIPNTREDLGNFMIMVYPIIMKDLQNGADRERVGSMVSLLNRLMNQIRMMLKENDTIRIDAEKKFSNLNKQMEAYGKLLEERNKQAMKLYKQQNKFKNKHPVLHRLFLIAGIAAAVFIALPAIVLISEGIRSASHKGITKTIDKENISLPYQIQEYFEVASDAEITTFDYDCNFKIEFEMKNIKLLPEELKISSIYLNKKLMWNSDFNEQIRCIKKNNSRKVILEESSGCSDADWDFIKKLESADQLSITIK